MTKCPCEFEMCNGNHFCFRCDEKLNPSTMVWLELSHETDLFSDPEKALLPDNESQGLFEFGPDCARAVLGKQKGRCWPSELNAKHPLNPKNF